VVSLYDHSEYLRVIDAEDSLRLCVARFPAARGQGKRRILCLHGNPSQLDHWRETVPMLAQKGEVVVYDEPGFGRSDRLTHGKPSLERSARIACALLDKLGWESGVDVVGQSHGGMVALALAALAPSRVRRLVLLGSGGTPAHAAYRMLSVPGAGFALAGLGAVLFRTLPVSGLRMLVRASAHSAFAPDPVPREFVDDEVSLLAKHPTVLLDMARLAADDPCSKVALYAARVTSPVLVLHGRDDALVPVAYARSLFEILRQASPSSRFVALPGGHMIHLSRPSIIAPEVEAWLA
jgi:pimeloyl-ACP methyl ester carboxylesterase